MPLLESAMKILVTGGSGFIGSHLCRELLNAGHTVYCLDNLLSSSINNIKLLYDNSNFNFIKHDVKEPIPLDIDQIYNLACPASPEWYQKDPVDTIQTCVQGAINMLKLAHNTGARILQASTSEVYGDPLVSPQTENYWGNVNPLGIRSCYDEGKRCAESLFINYHKEYNVDIKIARIFNTFGPNLSLTDGRVISNFILQALTDQDLTVYGEGMQTRSFCFVSDTVRGLIALMNSEETGPVNIGNPSEHTIVDIAKKIISLTGSSSRIIHLPAVADDPKQRRPDINLANTSLGWRPEINIDQGLLKTIDYFKEQI
jgi:UDP-glucuronate decarboxylase